MKVARYLSVTRELSVSLLADTIAKPLPEIALELDRFQVIDRKRQATGFPIIDSGPDFALQPVEVDA